MPDWKSPVELQNESVIFTKFMHALLGLYIYEWFISLNFDWQFISGKKRFRWPLIFYFAGRYLLLCAMIGIAISLDTTTKINCQALYTFTQLAGNAAVGLASINLSIRTIAVWSQNRYIIAFLVVTILGHWSLILQGVVISAAWVDHLGCVITATNNKILAATFVYSMCFDLVVLLLNAYKLLGMGSDDDGFKASRIAKMIFEDGLIFFMIAFVANLLATVFMFMNLNQIMSVIFNVPAAVASTIVASRVVRRLTNYTNPGAEIYASSQSGVVFRGQPNLPHHTTTIGTYTHKLPKLPTNGVHVQMETFTHEECLGNVQAKTSQRHRDENDTDNELEKSTCSLSPI